MTMTSNTCQKHVIKILVVLICNGLISIFSDALNNSGSRIIGGYSADKNSWRFIVAITRGRIFICGGSLIRTSWVLTAGHCVNPNNPNNINQTLNFVPIGVRVGPDDIIYKDVNDLLLNKSKSLSKKLVATVDNAESVAKIIMHADYQSVAGYLTYDIAILKLNKPVKLSENISLANLPSYSVRQVACKVAGWGGRIRQRASSHNKSFNVLHEVQLDLIERRLANASQICEVRKHKLCTRSVDKSTYYGDSGDRSCVVMNYMAS